jgi:hypothetical protein
MDDSLSLRIGFGVELWEELSDKGEVNDPSLGRLLT